MGARPLKFVHLLLARVKDKLLSVRFAELSRAASLHSDQQRTAYLCSIFCCKDVESTSTTVDRLW